MISLKICANWNINSLEQNLRKTLREIADTGKLTDIKLKETIANFDTIWISVQISTHSNMFPRSFIQQSVKNTSRNQSPGDKSTRGKKIARRPCKDYLKGTWTTPLWKNDNLHINYFTSLKRNADLGKKSALIHESRLMNSLEKISKNDDKISVVGFKNLLQLFHLILDMEQTKSSSILLKRSHTKM